MIVDYAKVREREQVYSSCAVLDSQSTSQSLVEETQRRLVARWELYVAGIRALRRNKAVLRLEVSLMDPAVAEPEHRCPIHPHPSAAPYFTWQNVLTWVLRSLWSGTFCTCITGH